MTTARTAAATRAATLALTFFTLAAPALAQRRHHHASRPPPPSPWVVLGNADLVHGASEAAYTATATTPVSRLRLTESAFGCDILPLGEILDLARITVTYADGHSVELPPIHALHDAELTRREVPLPGAPAAIRSVRIGYTATFPDCWTMRLAVEAAP